MKTKAFVLSIAALTAVAAYGSVLNVTTNADSGAGSLRAQIAAAASGDTVSITTTGTISLTTGEIAITGKNLVITGPGAGSLTVTTNGVTRALKLVNSQSSVSGITFNNCKGLPGDIDTGGAIAVDNFTAGGGSNLTTITDCVFTNNQSGWGGAVDVFNGGLTMNRCAFSGNSCTGVAFNTSGGGGALSLGPTVASTITNCTFSGNFQNGTAADQPGGAAVYNYGSGFANPPPVTIEHCTFHGNVDAASAAGAVKGNYTASYHTAARLKNCLLVNNQAPVSVLRNFAASATGTPVTSFTSLGGNVTDEAATSALFMTPGTDKTGVPSLGTSVSPTLALNGGVTRTHAITRGSAAQRAGVSSSTPTDQRGAPRHLAPDAGSFELIEPELGVTVADVPIRDNGPLDFGTTPFGHPVTRTVKVTNTQTSPFSTGPLLLGGASPPAGSSLAGFPTTALANGQSASFNASLDAGSPGLLDLPLTFTGNDAFDPALATTGGGLPNLHTIRLSGLVTDTIDHWRDQHFSIPEIGGGLAADHANPSGDGIVNLMKYSLGLDPHVSCNLSSAVHTELAPAGFLSMTVTRNPAALDINLAVEVTGDAGSSASWNSAGATIDLDTPTTLQAHDNVPMSSAPARFIRLKATRP